MSHEAQLPFPPNISIDVIEEVHKNNETPNNRTANCFMIYLMVYRKWCAERHKYVSTADAQQLWDNVKEHYEKLSIELREDYKRKNLCFVFYKVKNNKNKNQRYQHINYPAVNLNATNGTNENPTNSNYHQKSLALHRQFRFLNMNQFLSRIDSTMENINSPSINLNTADENCPMIPNTTNSNHQHHSSHIDPSLGNLNAPADNLTVTNEDYPSITPNDIYSNHQQNQTTFNIDQHSSHIDSSRN